MAKIAFLKYEERLKSLILLIKYLKIGTNYILGLSMNTELLEAIGKALYGNQWQTNLAKSLNIDSRRVRQWMNNERPMPDWLAKECKILLETNKTECEELIAKLA